MLNLYSSSKTFTSLWYQKWYTVFFFFWLSLLGFSIITTLITSNQGVQTLEPKAAVGLHNWYFNVDVQQNFDVFEMLHNSFCKLVNKPTLFRCAFVCDDDKGILALKNVGWYKKGGLVLVSPHTWCFLAAVSNPSSAAGKQIHHGPCKLSENPRWW